MHLIIASILAFLHLSQPAQILTCNGTQPDCQAKVNAAAAGDTVQIAGGNFTWTNSVTITKGITVLGNGTTITDSIPKSGNNLGAFKASGISDSGLLRISGIAFVGGSTSDYQGSGGEINIDRISSAPNIRIDNCNFNSLHMRPIWLSGSPLGVIDHSSFTMTNWVGGIIVGHQSYQGVGDYGDNSWAQPPQFGTDQAVFIEDCTFNNFSAATFIDSESGERIVVRHCTISASEAGNHGTETGQRHRGGRTFEFYQNSADGGALIHNWMLLLRSGSAVVWGNSGPVVNGVAGVQRYDSLVKFQSFRLWFPATPWGQADGTNPWDVNNPTVFAAGTATGGGTLQMVDTSRNWSVNQWAGYVLRNLSTGKASQVSSNTANTIHFDGNPQGTSMSFSAGNSYDIRHVDVILDQPGHGQGDLISGVNPVPIAWPHQALEGVWVWSNALGTTFGNGNGRAVVSTDDLTLVSGTDWHYSTDNSAALPGYQPYVYPHPLVTQGPTPTPAPSPTATVAPSPTPVPTATATPSATATVTPTATATPVFSPTPGPSPTPTASATSTPTATPAPTVVVLQPGQSITIQAAGGATIKLNAAKH